MRLTCCLNSFGIYADAPASGAFGGRSGARRLSEKNAFLGWSFFDIRCDKG
jgi:hypothetical protein